MKFVSERKIHKKQWMRMNFDEFFKGFSKFSGTLHRKLHLNFFQNCTEREFYNSLNLIKPFFKKNNKQWKYCERYRWIFLPWKRKFCKQISSFFNKLFHNWKKRITWTFPKKMLFNQKKRLIRKMHRFKIIQFTLFWNEGKATKSFPMKN